MNERHSNVELNKENAKIHPVKEKKKKSKESLIGGEGTAPPTPHLHREWPQSTH